MARIVAQRHADKTVCRIVELKAKFVVPASFLIGAAQHYFAL